MKWFGLTGGIASGKSTVATMMGELGVVIVDADVVAREVVEPGERALALVTERFGADVLDGGGRLDRAALGAIVFGDDAARRDLNAILHPAIAARSAAHLARHREAGRPFVVYDAALIVENQLYQAMDGLVVVDVPPEVQVARVRRRDGLSEDDAWARVRAQAERTERLAVATWVVDNTGSHEDTRARVDEVVAQMCQRAGVERPDEEIEP